LAKYRLQASGVDFEKLLIKAAQYYEIDPDILKTASKERWFRNFK
jgi:hypothetical protein